MKKTLVALAALAATASFAQSSVSIDGTLDVGVKATSAAATSTGSASKTEVNASGNTTTTRMYFRGVEDIGGGLKAGFWLEIDPTLGQSSTLNTSKDAVNFYNGTPFNGEQVLYVAGNFGQVNLGTANAASLDASNASQPFGTAMGSGYSSSFGRLGATGLGVNQTAFNTTSSNRVIRSEKVVQYITPAFNGFTAKVEWSGQNDNKQALDTANTEGFVGLGLNYNNGPLNVVYAYNNVKFGANAIPLGATTTNAVATSTSAQATSSGVSNVSNTDVSWNSLTGNYTFGATTVYAGFTTTKQSGSGVALEDATSANIGVKYAVSGALDVAGNYLTRTSNVSNAAAVTAGASQATGGAVAARNAKLIGLGADYKLSKRTAVYYRFELVDTDTNMGNTLGGSVTTANAIGIRHAF